MLNLSQYLNNPNISKDAKIETLIRELNSKFSNTQNKDLMKNFDDIDFRMKINYSRIPKKAKEYILCNKIIDKSSEFFEKTKSFFRKL